MNTNNTKQSKTFYKIMVFDTNRSSLKFQTFSFYHEAQQELQKTLNLLSAFSLELNGLSEYVDKMYMQASIYGVHVFENELA